METDEAGGEVHAWPADGPSIGRPLARAGARGVAAARVRGEGGGGTAGGERGGAAVL